MSIDIKFDRLGFDKSAERKNLVHMLQNLESRRRKLLQEADEIQSDIQVSKIKFSYEANLHEPTACYPLWT